MAQWTEHCPANWKVPTSILGQGTRPGCGSGPQLGVCERRPHIDVSLAHQCFSPSLSPSLPFSLKIKSLKKEWSAYGTTSVIPKRRYLRTCCMFKTLSPDCVAFLYGVRLAVICKMGVIIIVSYMLIYNLIFLYVWMNILNGLHRLKDRSKWCDTWRVSSTVLAS